MTQPKRSLDYATPQSHQPSDWPAWPFSLSGPFALACLCSTFFLHGHDDLKALLFVSSFFACITCVVSAFGYLRSIPENENGPVQEKSGTRILAHVAIALAIGFLVLCVAVVVFAIIVGQSMSNRAPL
jgi:hypothetical protein